MIGIEEAYERVVRLSKIVPDLPVELIMITRLVNHIHKGIRDTTNKVAKRYNLSETTYIALAVIYGSENQQISTGQLAEACSEKPANMSRICNELEQKGLITRAIQTHDRRSITVTLTDAGLGVVAQALPAVWSTLPKAFAGLNEQEIKQLTQLQHRVLYNLMQMEHMI